MQADNSPHPAPARGETEPKLRIDDAQVGDRVYVRDEKRPYTVQARGGHFLVCTKPHFETVLYFIADLKERVRGPENLIFGLGAETRAQCEEMIRRLRGIDREAGLTTEVSHRHRVDFDFVRIVRPAAVPSGAPSRE